MTKGSVVLILLSLLVTVFILGYAFIPGFRGAVNLNQYAVQKADDATRYATLKKVEDTCRAMRASYEADKQTWKQYKDSADEEKRSWADQAQMRANKTAASYNEYVLKNSFVWSDNVPGDIDVKLPYIE